MSIESNGSITLGTNNSGQLIAGYNGLSLAIYLAEVREGMPARIDYFIEGHASDFDITGWQGYAADLDENGDRGVLIRRNQFLPGYDYHQRFDDNPWIPTAYDVFTFSLETGQINGIYYDNGQHVDIATALDRVDLAAAGNGSTDYLYDILYWDSSEGRESALLTQFDYVINPSENSASVTLLPYSSYSVDNTKIYNINIADQSSLLGDSFALSGDSRNVISSSTYTIINSDYAYVGGYSSDRLIGNQGANGNSWAHDFVNAGAGDDFLGGGGGRDVLHAGSGDDELRAGYGHDILVGGTGADILYGGGGRNTYNNNDDGSIDELYVLSDYHSHGYEWGRLHNGANADTISSLGTEDRITILGCVSEELSIHELSNGLGIFADGSLEAIVTDSSWDIASLESVVSGDASRLW